MPVSSSRLLSRLRRHRGLWSLAFVVLLLKLVTGTICLADGARYTGMSPTQSGSTAAIIVADPMASLASDDDSCVLGEGSECHCTCVHSLALPTVGTHAVDHVAAGFVFATPSASQRPAPPGALHRPPIA